MERYEVGDDARWSAILDAAARGEEAVITQHGSVVAEVTAVRDASVSVPATPIDMDALRRLRARVPAAFRVGDAAALIRKMRDADEH